jgi:hypothetical protein
MRGRNGDSSEKVPLATNHPAKPSTMPFGVPACVGMASAALISRCATRCHTHINSDACSGRQGIAHLMAWKRKMRARKQGRSEYGRETNLLCLSRWFTTPLEETISESASPMQTPSGYERCAGQPFAAAAGGICCKTFLAPGSRWIQRPKFNTISSQRSLTMESRTRIGAKSSGQTSRLPAPSG